MKKLFNYALLAAALLIGVNVNAVNDCTVSIDGGAAEPASFQETMVAIATNAGDVYTSKTIDIKLTDNVAIVGEGVPNYPNTWNIKHHQVINIDLNEKNIVGEFFRFRIKESTLNLTGKGILQNTDEKENSACMLYAIGVGSDALITADPTRKTVITIGKDVTILNNVETAKSTYGVGIMNSTYVKSVSNDDNDNGSFGVTITIDGTVNALNPVTILGTVNKTEGTYLPVININGHIIANAKLREVFWNPGDPVKSNTDEDALRQNNINYYKTTNAALYAAGFGVYNIKGTLEGGIGAYIKGGKIDIKDATIKATSEEFWAPLAYGSGYVGAGSALVIDNNAGYGGNMDVKVDGNTTISSESGYGIQEVVTQGEVTTQNITIIQGKISGAEDKGAIVTTEVTKDYTNIEGGTFNSDITEYLGDNNIVTPVDNGDGTTSYVIGKKENEDAWVTSINAVTKTTDYVKLTGTDETLNNDVEAEYLVANTTAKVTIPEGKTLKVGEIVMSKDAQIVVEKGAKLIVEGTKGIVANQATNIVLKSEENAPAYFLLDPQVTSNKTPKATVTYTSGAYKIADGQFSFDFFGAPMGTVNKVTSSSNVYTSWFDVNDKGSSWTTIGSIKEGVADLDYSLFSRPFGFFQIQSYNPSTELITYTFEGNVFGNSSPEVACQAGWPGFSNAYTGDIDVETFCEEVDNLGFEFAVYTYTQVGNNTLVWTANNPVSMKERALAPMRSFMLRNTGAAKNLAMDYKAMVWNPAMEGPAGAPRMSNIEKATVRIEGANGIFDELTVAQDESFDANCKYNAEKYMNTDLNIYVKGEKNLAIAATDNLNNTFVGFNCKNAGKYTMSFEGVTGNFALVDTKTNARIEMSEGNTYEFLAEAGEDAYRFQIVEAAKAPTNTPATKAAVKATKALINDQIVINNGERFFNMLGTDVK